MNNANPKTARPYIMALTEAGASSFAVCRADAAKHVIDIKDSIWSARNAGDEALVRALTIQAKGIRNDLAQLIDLLAEV